ncbi:MAG TPA: LuxR C-terminal-related transcriptional regulator, partial [Thermoleophilia bacterium]
EEAEAECWAVKAEGVLARYPDVGMLRGRTKRLREALEERRMADPLTTAERRILDLLPTQLTAGQMATRLFLTENTVKSHLSHIYRKLGVTTRTDAVETAHRLGLL